MKFFPSLMVLAVLNSQSFAQTNTFPSSGDVGIGTTSPDAPLSILIPSFSGKYATFGRNSALSTLDLFSDSYGHNFIRSGYGDLAFSTTAGGFASSAIERMRILMNGNIGIGTTSPLSKLDIITGIGDGTTNEANCLRLRSNATDGNAMLLQMGVSNVGMGGNNNGHAYISATYWGGSDNNPLILNPKGGPVGAGSVTGLYWGLTVANSIGIKSPAFTAQNDLMGKLTFSLSGSYGANSAFIAGVYDKANFYQGTGLVFHTISGSDISGSTGIERMRISSDGNIGIGTNNPTAKLHVNGSSLINILSNSDQFLVKSSGSQNWRSITNFNVTDDDGVSNSYGLKVMAYNQSGNRYLDINQYNATGVTFSGGSYIFINRPVFLDGITNQYHNDFNIVLRENTGNPSSTGIKFYSENFGSNPIMSLMQTGNIGIGTTSPSEKLAVNGNIVSKKVRVTQTGWADYVFHPTYQLPSLTEVEAYLKEHQHLKDIPSAKEVEEKGLDLGANQAALLKKIEELTLYAIQQQKEIDELKKENRALQQLQSEIKQIKQILTAK